MKILVGIQGTGNGHLSRCAALAEALGKYPQVQVDYLVSGRPKEQLFDMEVFGNWQWREGLSFVVQNGRVNVRETLSRNNWQQFWRDARGLNIADYDLIVSDYEPITAWAGRLQGKPVIGLGRQYAFYKETPSLPISALQRQLLRWFAPAKTVVGMHWLDDVSHVLPPIIHQRGDRHRVIEGNYLVYLPFEGLGAIHGLLNRFPQVQFHVFHPAAEEQQIGHIRYSAPSRVGFAEAMAQAEGIISNAGFETASEALALGKKLLVKPLVGQFEQLANANCLQQARLAMVMKKLDSEVLGQFLASVTAVQCQWPNVADAVARWLANGAKAPVHQLSSDLWSHMEWSHMEWQQEHLWDDSNEFESGSPGWIRTNDTWINSPPL